MNHPTEMANALTPTCWLYSLSSHTLNNQNQHDCPSISFLLDSDVSISVLICPTYITFVKRLNISRNDTLNSSKNLTANQTDVHILHYVTLTFTTTIESDSRQFIIPFTVAHSKHIILGTPFIEE